MEGLLNSLLGLPELKELQNSISQGSCPALLHGVAGSQRALLAAALHQATSRPLFVVCSDEKEVSRTANDLQSLLHVEPTILPSREWLLRPTSTSGHEWEHNRLSALFLLACNRSNVVITTPEALVQRAIPKDVLLEATLHLTVGSEYDLATVVESLVKSGYSRCEQIDGPGQFALRGGILDVFSPGTQYPIRCEFFDTELDTMGIFNLSTQRRIKNIPSAVVLPSVEVLPGYADKGREDLAKKLTTYAKKLDKKEGAETLQRTLLQDADAILAGNYIGAPDRYLSCIYHDKVTPLDYIPEDSLVILCESSRVSESIKGYIKLEKEDILVAVENQWLAAPFADFSLSESGLKTALQKYPVIQLDSLPTSRSLFAPKTLLSANYRQLSTYGGSLDAAAGDVSHYLGNGYRVLVLCGGEVRCQNMDQFLRERSFTTALDYQCSALPEKGSALISVGALSGGCDFPSLQLAILTEGQLTDAVIGKKKNRVAKDANRQRIQSYTDLTPGDLVVHVHHGIGRFVGVIRMPVDGIEKDYIKISYAGSDCLYVPCTNLDLVSKYIGAGEDNEKPVRLNKLGGTDWAKATSKAKKAAKDLAEGLIQLYAERQRLGGFAFSPDSPWQMEFEDAFDYELTDDQIRSTLEIKEDMEKAVPMDRLLCGDVGYGKTEVALRACMKCILDGKQAAILVPTTVLAQQHFITATNRFRSFPVTIEVLSRFRSTKECNEVLKRTKEGNVDLLIGTHKLLQKDVEFKNLGLLIVDEEQRFGVSHKEKLREKARQVDTLTLSATPIPRTLNMALSGIRDMSTIEEPPIDRQVVQTYVLEHDWGTVIEAISRELNRGGQVYYLHNRVEDIESTALKIKERLGEGYTIATAHGKMSEKDLSSTMERMMTGEIDVLVCTTIIETGIDIPNVNTLIVEDADHMGLAQLHQIRGRIGRSARRAYAYFTYKQGKVLTEIASKRLTAIREYVEFGAGFKIAMRDMEIRGAGNLLGPEQSGYMMSVGYDMYLRLLNDAILEGQGKSEEVSKECTADLSVSANIPDSYVASSEQRMDLYRRIAAIRNADDYDDVLDEMEDRFGEVPKSVQALLDIALLRNDAKLLNVEDITQKENRVVFSFNKSMNGSAVVALCAMPSYRARLRLSATESPKLTLFLQPKQDPLKLSAKLIEDLRLQDDSHPREENNGGPEHDG